MAGAAKEYQSRSFLNSYKGMAAVEARTEFYHTNFCYASFCISDCNRVVNLDFDYKDSTERQQRLEKLNVLLEELQKFKQEIFPDAN